MNVIHIRNLNKRYRKDHVLKDVNLDISGSFGLLGPNGAGKTTLIRILCTVVQPDGGRIYTDDDLDWTDLSKVKGRIGYLPQFFSFYKKVTVYQCLSYIGLLKGVEKEHMDEEILKVLKATHLEDQKAKQVKKLSGGMLRRLGIAQALLNDPPFIFVDEPTVGLDIEEQVHFRQLLRKLGQNRTILISSHIVEDIESSCDNICLLKEGRVLASGSLSQLVGSINGKIREKRVAKQDLNNLSEPVLSIKEDQEAYRVRYLSNHDRTDQDDRVIQPSLADFYLYMMHQGARP